MLRKHESASLRLVVTLIHLSLFAELGVVTRTFLDKFFVLGCSGGWGPCLEGGAYFKDLPANMLGCYIIGLVAASSTLGLATDKALAVLPRGHSWQANLELQIGVRTGYCGSLTTFASWQLELVVLAVQQHLWVEAVLGFLTGLFASVGFYVLGMHTALAIDRWVWGERFVLEEMGLYRQSQVAYLEGLRADSGETPAQRLLEQAEPDLPRLKFSPLPSGGKAAVELAQRHSHEDPGQQASAAPAAAAEENGRPAEGSWPLQAEGEEEGGQAKAAAAFVALAEKERQLSAQLSSQREQQQQQQVAAAADSDSAEADQPLTASGLVGSLRGYKTDGAALLALVLLSAGCAAGVGLETRHSWLRSIWVSCLLGPPGCILRWWLSRWNYRLRGRWDWFPGGTFAANMLGTAVDFALQCVLQRGAVVGYWGALMIGSVQTGFCGSLTTVSTFVTEVVKFAEAVPANFRAHTYALLSLGSGFALGLAIYGWSVWAG